MPNNPTILDELHKAIDLLARVPDASRERYPLQQKLRDLRTQLHFRFYKGDQVRSFVSAYACSKVYEIVKVHRNDFFSIIHESRKTSLALAGHWLVPVRGMENERGLAAEEVGGRTRE